MKTTMKEINKIYEMCGLAKNEKTADISFVHDFPIPNRLISEMDDSAQPVSPQEKITYGFIFFGSKK